MRVRQTERLYKIGFSQIVLDFESVGTTGVFSIYRHVLGENESVRSVSRSSNERNIAKHDFFEVNSYDDLENVVFSAGDYGAYFYDSFAGELFFINRFGDLSSSIENAGTFNFLSCAKYLFFSDFKDLTTNENPVLDAGALRLYENRVLSRPEIERDFSDSFFGVLSISTNSITLNNRDAFLNKFFQAGFTFYDQPVQIFRRDNFDESFSLEAINTIRNFNSGKKEATLELSDFNYNLEGTYTSIFNDVPEQQTWLRWIDLKPTGEIQRDFQDIALKEVIGSQIPTSYYGSGRSGGPLIDTVAGVDGDSKFILPESLVQACNVDDIGSQSETNNRKWAVGIGKAGESAAPLYNATVTGQNFTIDMGAQFDGLLKHIIPGEWCFVQLFSEPQSSAARFNKIEDGIAYFWREGTDGSDGFQAVNLIIVSVPLVLWRLETGAVSSGFVWLEIPPEFYSVDDEDLGLANGRVFKTITFVNNFETALGIGAATLPNQEIRCKMRNMQSIPDFGNEGAIDLLRDTLEEINVPFSSSSFDDAADFFNPPVAINYDHDFTYQDIVELILESLFGFLSLNNQGEFEFHFHSLEGEQKSITKENVSIFSESLDAAYDETFNALKPIHINDTGLSRGCDLSPRLDCPFAQALDGRIAVKETRTIVSPEFEPTLFMPNVSQTASAKIITLDTRMALRFLRNSCSGFYNYDATINEEDELVEIADSPSSDFLRIGLEQKIKITYLKDQTLRKSISGFRLNRENFEQVMYLEDENGIPQRYDNLRKDDEE